MSFKERKKEKGKSHIIHYDHAVAGYILYLVRELG